MILLLWLSQIPAMLGLDGNDSAVAQRSELDRWATDQLNRSVNHGATPAVYTLKIQKM